MKTSTLSLVALFNETIDEAKKKADKDYDKDGKIESPKEEYKGSRIRAGKKMDKKGNEPTESKTRNIKSTKPHVRAEKSPAKVNENEGYAQGQQATDWNRSGDHEASMAKSEILDMIKNASEIHKAIKEGDNLPGWVSSYITLAADYMHSVSEYIAGMQAGSDEQNYN